jgi:predicted transcriptional regulator
MSGLERLCDLLFEVSNEDRLRILLQLKEGAMRVTDISRELSLSIQESSRHVSRLGDVGLARKDVEGFYSLTNFGELMLRHLREIEFTSKHREYFTDHTLARLPPELVKRMGDLAGGTYMHNVMDFLHSIENMIEESEEWVWLLVDQYPMSALTLIGEALDRGVEFRCLEPYEVISGPVFSFLKPEEVRSLRRARTTPLVEQRTLKSIDVFLFLSEKMCALAFPNSKGEFDYRGFIAKDEKSLKWCVDLFRHYWETAEPRVYISPTEYVQPKRIIKKEVEMPSRIIVEGRDDSSIDYQAVQDAVDNYDEVILRGTFNLGTSTVVISRSTVIRGEGRDDDVPLTKVYKSGWTFTLRTKTFVQSDHVFLVDGEGADITIENIHFTDFNYECLDGHQGNSMKIRNNRITLETGLGRGASILPYGDFIQGIAQHGGFPGGVVIEGNYLDFALSPIYARLVPSGHKEDTKYRPDLLNHEYYCGVGILVKHACGKTIIADNVIRNMNGAGIMAYENMASLEVIIRNNIIVSAMHGSFITSLRTRNGTPERRWAGFGIGAQTSMDYPQPGFYVEITDNLIKYDKLNYCGIMLQGPDDSPEGSGKLSKGIVRNNRVHLENGAIGIYSRSCDGFEITNNTLTGKAYYGIGILPEADLKRTELGAHENIIEDNDMGGFEIKDPDEYSKSVFDERICTGSKGGFITANIWLNNNTKGNVVKVSSGETVVDEGEDNTIICE